MTDSTTGDRPELAGATAVVTGANSGLGLETTRELARRGAEVVMACRNHERAEAARREIRDDVPDADLPIVFLDLADLSAVADFADTVTDRYDELDLLVNNAGVMALPRGETADGFEMQLGVNHLGHFALTGQLVDLVRAADGRVVTVSSGAHRTGDFDFEDLHWEGSYGKWRAYARSKLGNLLFAFELQRRLDAAGAGVESVAAHPGWADTDLQRRGPEMEGSKLKATLMGAANRLLAQSATAGAKPILHAATGDVDPAGYYGPGGLLEMRGDPTRVESVETARDEALARRLWEVSESETGVEFGLPDPETEATVASTDG
ncbi:MAG: oxidoreductase [Halobacteriales archaeon]